MSARRLDLEELRSFGYLQEVNRLFLHPLGLALSVTYQEGSEPKLEVLDARDEPDGMIFGAPDPEKAARVGAEIRKRHEVRQALLGFVVEPIGPAS